MSWFNQEWKNNLTLVGAFVCRLGELCDLVLRLYFTRSAPPAIRFRRFFEEAGGAFLKLGQILALRNDLLPYHYTVELLSLLAHVKETPFFLMEKVFVADFGLPPKDFFQSFDENPIASGSIGQVYQGVTNNDEKVAIKIKRPGIEQVFETDFIVASFLGGVVGIVHIWRGEAINEAVGEFISWTRKELDFLVEAKNGVALYEHAKNHSAVVFPRVYAEISTSNVLVLEFMEDIITVDRIIMEINRDPSYVDWLRTSRKLDVKQMAEHFTLELMRQYFVDGFFHADPHPANVFFASGGRIGYFDFGIVGRASDRRSALLQIVRGIADHDLYFSSQYFFSFAKKMLEDEISLFSNQDRETYERYIQAIKKVEEIIVDGFRDELEKILNPFYSPEGSEDLQSSERRTISRAFSHILARAAARDIHLPSEVVVFFRMIIIADMVALSLDPSFNMIQAFNRFFREFPAEKIMETIIARTHEADLDKSLDTASHLSFEQLVELKAVEREHLAAARERLFELVTHYAEEYDEVRQLLQV